MFYIFRIVIYVEKFIFLLILFLLFIKKWDYVCLVIWCFMIIFVLKFGKKNEGEGFIKIIYRLKYV